MGNTTIIELNHDCVGDIDNNKDAFVEQIIAQMQLGCDYEHPIIGGRIIAFFPRYDENRKYRAWTRWLSRWMKKI